MLSNGFQSPHSYHTLHRPTKFLLWAIMYSVRSYSIQTKERIGMGALGTPVILARLNEILASEGRRAPRNWWSNLFCVAIALAEIAMG